MEQGIAAQESGEEARLEPTMQNSGAVTSEIKEVLQGKCANSPCVMTACVPKRPTHFRPSPGTQEGPLQN